MILWARGSPAVISVRVTAKVVKAMSCHGKLFVGGLSFNTDKHSLEDCFSQYGQISEVVVIKDRETQRSRGFGFITFTKEDDAKEALRALNGETLDGRQIRVDHASHGGGYSRGGGGYGGGSRDYYGGGGRSGGFGRYDN